MSGKLLQAVWSYRGKDLDCTETHILARMAWYASDAGGDIFPSIKTLCEETKLGRSQMYERLSGLKEKGFLIPEGVSNKQTKRYRISVEKLGLINEFSNLSSQLELNSTRPETGHLPVRKPDTTRPETGHNRLHKYYIEKHDHNDVVKKKGKNTAKKPSIKDRLGGLNWDERCIYDKLSSLKGIFAGAALSIVEEHSIGEINNVLELALGAEIKNPGAYVISSLHKPSVDNHARE